MDLIFITQKYIYQKIKKVLKSEGLILDYSVPHKKFHLTLKIIAGPKGFLLKFQEITHKYSGFPVTDTRQFLLQMHLASTQEITNARVNPI